MDKNYVAEFEEDMRRFGIEPPDGGCVANGLYHPCGAKHLPYFYALSVGISHSNDYILYGSTGRMVLGNKSIVITDMANHGRVPGEDESCH